MFREIPGSTLATDKPIERYADFIEPGRYELEEGDSKTFADIAEDSYGITIEEIPSSSTNQ